MNELDKVIDSLSDEEVDLLNSDPEMLAQFKAKYSSAPQSADLSGSVMPDAPGLFGTSLGKGTPWMEKWRQGLAGMKGFGKAMSQNVGSMIPDAKTQSVPLNAALNTPKTLAQIGADASTESSIGQVSPEGLAIQGGLAVSNLVAPAVNFAGRYVGSEAEKLSGLGYKKAAPGVLAETTTRPGLPFAPGVKTVNEGYAAAADPEQVRSAFSLTPDNELVGFQEQVNQAIKAAQDFSLTPDEALLARQSLDHLHGRIPNNTFFELRDIFDDVAKEKFAGLDQAYKDAGKAEAMRNLFPLNQNGTPSRLGQVIQGGALGLGPKLGKWAIPLAPIISPAGQALTASGVGVARQGLAAAMANPQLAAGTYETLSGQLRKK